MDEVCSYSVDRAGLVDLGQFADSQINCMTNRHTAVMKPKVHAFGVLFIVAIDPGHTRRRDPAHMCSFLRQNASDLLKEFHCFSRAPDQLFDSGVGMLSEIPTCCKTV